MHTHSETLKKSCSITYNRHTRIQLPQKSSQTRKNFQRHSYKKSKTFKNIRKHAHTSIAPICSSCGFVCLNPLISHDRVDRLKLWISASLIAQALQPVRPISFRRCDINVLKSLLSKSSLLDFCWERPVRSLDEYLALLREERNCTWLYCTVSKTLAWRKLACFKQTRVSDTLAWNN